MTTTMTLADLAATSLSAIRILEHHGLDYCCGGKQPFDEACLAKGVKPETIIREIEDTKVANVAGRDWQTAPLDELVKRMESGFDQRTAFVGGPFPGLATSPRARPDLRLARHVRHRDWLLLALEDGWTDARRREPRVDELGAMDWRRQPAMGGQHHRVPLAFPVTNIGGAPVDRVPDLLRDGQSP